MKRVATAMFFLLIYSAIQAQVPASKEQQDLEKQRQQLKKELQDAQALLDKNRKTTKENLSTLITINRKLNIQENMISTINKQINAMDDNIYRSQRDINKLRLILDTLKQEYAKSMIYAYKNRSSSDFLNFIFSSSSFNDAIKRVNYLKSYRNYREMQGENITRTHTQLKARVEDLNVKKQKKNETLEVQNQEADALQKQQEEKNRIVAQLKAQGKELNNQITAKKNQMTSVNKAITAAIKRAMKEAAEERKRKEALAKANAAAIEPSTTKTKKSTTTKPTVTPEKREFPNVENTALNENFERNKGNLPWPVSGGYLLLHYGRNELANKVIIDCQGISIGSDIGTPVRAVFDGEVILVNNYDNIQLVVIKHGRYFTGYSNITGVSLTKGQTVKVGQVIGRAAANLDGVGAVDFQISKEGSELNPQSWLKGR